MSSELRLRRGTTLEHSTFTGADGEVTFDTDKNALVSHDGATPGGFPGGGFKQSGTGAVVRSTEAKLQETASAADMNAAGDGTTDDTAKLQNLKSRIESKPTGIAVFSGGRYKTLSNIWSNNISQLTIYSDKPSVLGLFDGTAASPNTVDNDPVLWAQKFTKYDNGTDRFAHNIGGVFGEVNIMGSGVTGATDTDGTWIGAVGNAVLNGVNQGTSGAPDFDAYGSVIGVAGFAKSAGYPGSGNIVTGMWAYAEGPTLDATTFANLPATNWSICGQEVNIKINHPDIGEQSVLVGKGSSVGQFLKNYRATGAGVKDWTFGFVLDGSLDGGDSTNVDNWSGFYCGGLIDKIKGKGIRFGQYFKDGSYGIYFPDSYAGTQEPKAAIYIGNSKINLGQYVGANWYDNDFWHNGGELYFKYSGTTNRVIQERNAVAVINGALCVGTSTSLGGAATFSKVAATADIYNRTQHSTSSGFVFQRANNSGGTPSPVVANDRIGGVFFAGYDSSGYTNTATYEAYAAETHTGSARGTYQFWTTTAIGSASRTERLYLGPSGDLIHRARATTIVDSNSHLGLRSYTVGTLPSASTAARMIYVSDGTSNKRLAVSDGTNWRWPDGAIVS